VSVRDEDSDSAMGQLRGPLRRPCTSDPTTSICAPGKASYAVTGTRASNDMLSAGISAVPHYGWLLVDEAAPPLTMICD
jgi:hypothetical protein